MNTERLDQSPRTVEDSRIGNPPTVTAGQPEGGEDQFRLLVESVKDYAIFMLDPKGHIISWNAGAHRIKGYTAEEIIGQHFSRFYPPEDRDRGKPDRGLAIATAAGRYEDEGWRLRKDGTRFVANVVITALWDKAGRLRGFAKVTRDLTERQLLASAAQTVERYYQLVFEASPLPMFVLDRKSKRFLAVNQAALDLYGFTREEMLTMGVPDVRPPPDVSFFVGCVPKKFTRGQRINIWRHRCKDGAVLDLEMAIGQLTWDGQPALLVLANDVTQRRQSEEALRRANFTLQSIFDAAPVAVLSLDSAGRVTHWSRGAERLFGWTAAEALGQLCPTVPPEGREDFHAMIARVLRDGSETGLVRCRQKKSGERIYASLCPAPLRDADGRAVGVIVILEDVTDRVCAEQDLEEHSKRLAGLSRQLIRAQEDERRRIARELHDQVGQALTLLQLGLQGTQELTDASAIARELGQHVAATAQLLEQVRNLSLDLRPSLLDDLGLVPALRWYTDRVGRSARMQIRFETGLVNGRLPAEIETACFRTAQEALTNALRHSRARTAQVQLVRENGGLILTVQDDGCGFDPDEARQRASSGGSMGLLTMAERVTLLGGRLALESSPGNGARIRASFPLPNA